MTEKEFKKLTPSEQAEHYKKIRKEDMTDKLNEEVKAMTFEDWHLRMFGSESTHSSNLCKRERDAWHARDPEVAALSARIAELEKGNWNLQEENLKLCMIITSLKNKSEREAALLEGLKVAKEALEIFRNANGMSDCSNEHLHNMAMSSANVRSPAKAEQFYRSAIKSISALLSTEAQQ